MTIDETIKRKRGVVSMYTFVSGEGNVDISEFTKAYLGEVREDLTQYQAEQDAAIFRLYGIRRIR